MKIVQTPVRFFPAIGGVEKYVLDLSIQLVDLGNQVTVICANEPDIDCPQVHGIHVKRLPFWFKLAETNITPSLFFELLKEDFDLIHTHFPTPWSAELSLVCAKIKGKPCILTYHNDVEKKGILGFLTKIYTNTILKFLLGHVDKILITQPRYMEDSRVLNKYRDKVAIISNGVSKIAENGNHTREKATLLFVGLLDHYHRYKGLDYLIESISILKKNWPNIRLEVVGKGELIEEYRELAECLGLANHVHFNGYVDDQALSELYRSSTIFILPSIDLHEGFGIVLLEAMAAGMPVITTEIVGISKEIKEREAGFIVPPKDPVALAKAVDFLLCYPRAARITGENGKKLVREKYLWKEISKKLVDVYQGLVQ